MRILDQTNDTATNSILLVLPAQQATELRDSLDRLLASDETADHSHISSENFDKEITVCLYDPDQKPQPPGWHKRIERLIIFDE